MIGARAALPLWVLFLAGCAWVVAHARYTADMSAFLPALPTPIQQLLAEQLRDGVASRLILVGLEGASPEALARLSMGMAQRLKERREFAYVANGEARLAATDREVLFAQRYLLSPAVARERFEQAGLTAALDRVYEALASPAGVLVRRYLPADPTGEFLQVLGALEGTAQPARHMGVWFSRDGRTALLLAQTVAPGFELDAQTRNLALLEQDFVAARAASEASTAVLHMTGPAVFAVRSRDAIRHDARALSALAAGVIALALAAAFRAPRLVLLAFVPVATGALAGVAAVAFGFGVVHVITLGFGVTLIGEGVDYAIYLFSQRDRHETTVQSLARIWPTLRLGTLTSVASFCAMLASGFPGLAQLGLFSAVGIVVALGTTRAALPYLMGPVTSPGIARNVPRWRIPHRARWLVTALVLSASVAVVWRHRPVWDDDLARINPVSAADQQLDQRLRAELGAPDVRLLLVVAGASEDEALERCEGLAPTLDALVREGVIRGFDSPARYLPSRHTQAARQQALPDEAELRASLRAAVVASPFQGDTFAPFLRDVAAARTAPPVTRATFRGTALGLKLDALLVERRGAWYALVPLRGVDDAGAFTARTAELWQADVTLLDIKSESTTLLMTYREHALRLWALGLALIGAALYAQLRSVARVLAVIVPIGVAVAATCAVLLAAGAKLTLFHLVALLLVVGVGSNYALFFDRVYTDDAEHRKTVFAIVFCAATTIVAFGVLAWSRAPVLNMIGTTVALGAALSLVLTAVITPRVAGRDG